MEKFSFTKILGLCLMVFGMFAAQTGYAQCPAGQAEVSVTYVGGAFNGENSWLLWDATAGAELLCDDAPSVPGTYTACANDGSTIEIYAWETFGDNWNGATLAVNMTEDGSANGCDPLNDVVMAANGNPGGADGNGSLNACPGGTPGDGAGGALAAPPYVVALTGCAGGGGGGGGAACDLQCPQSVYVVTTASGSDCEGYVTIEQPLASSGCDLSTLTHDSPSGITDTDASGWYPLGTTDVEYCIVDQSTGGQVCCTVQIIVEDNTPPAFTCPGNLTINLDAGECEAFMDFDISASDECNMLILNLHQNGGLTLDPSNFLTNAIFTAGGGVVCAFVPELIGYGRLFDLNAAGYPATADFEVTTVDFVTNLNNINYGPTTVSVYSFPAGTTVPTFAAQTLLATVDVNLPISFGNTLHTVNIPTTVPAGELAFVTTEAISDAFGGTIFASEGGPFGGAPELAPSYVFGCASLGLFPDYTNVDGFFPGYSHMVQLNGGNFGSDVPVDAALGNPYANGDALPIGGPYCFEYTAQDLAGNVSSCEFCVTVKEYPSPSGSLSCNAPGVEVSLDANCQAVVGADDILEGGSYGCYDDYLVELFYNSALTQPVPTSPILTSQEIGDQIWVRVTDPATGNSCWTWITVEDKLVPALDCVDGQLACNDPTTPGFVGGLPGGTASASVQDGGNWASTGSFDNDFPIAGAGTVTDVNISVDITHTWVGDLTVTITSPSGTSVTVFGGQCGNTDDVDATFDDESANPFQCGGGVPVLSGTMRPQNALSAFDGEIAEGTWVVNVADGIGGDGGNINELVLEVGYSGTINSIPFPVPASTVASGNNPYQLIGFDPCGPATLSYVDAEVAGDCVNDDFIKQILRTWTVVDASGNTKSCVQTIDVLRSTVDDVEFPLNRDGLELPYFACNGNWAQDANGHPAPSASGSPTVNGQPITSGGVCEFGVTYEDLVIPICEGTYKILRTWTVVAWCPTTTVVTDLQVIKVVDGTGPSVVCAPNQNISTGQNDCTASAIIAYPTVTDACGSTSFVSVTVSNGVLNAQKTAVFGLPLGPTTVTFVYKDACGNTGTCSYTINVADLVPPVAICESFHVVGLTIDEPTLVPAAVFDDGSYDNCGPVTLKVRRMDSPNCPGNDGFPVPVSATNFSTHVPFYCCDVAGQNVMIELQVKDAAGNTNTCMVEVEVQDKLNPAIQCPPNITLDCWEDAYDLAITGTATASDNCSAVVTFFNSGSLDNCGEGTIFRIWTATDPGGRIASCNQRIDVINSTPFYICDTEGWCEPTAPSCTHPLFNIFQHTLADGVEWPCDITLSTCGPGLLPDDLEANPAVNINNVRPRIFEDACDLVGVTYEDVNLPVTAPACLKVLRTWKVYDWCTFDAENFDPNNPTASEGYWEYTQIIKVLNSADPVITSSCENVSFCSYDPNCQVGPATLLITATDDCTEPQDINYEYKIDANNDGSINIIGSGPDASGNYPIGTHKITWYVEDGCGNVTICSYLFIIADCKNPTPNLLNGIATEMMENCQITIWATDFDNPSSPSFDNCGIQEWRIVTPSQGPGQTAPPAGSTSQYTFSGVGQIGTNNVDIWIKDINGNWAYVSTYILVQDNLAPFCTGSQTVQIAGDLETEEAEMVDETMLAITGNAPGVPDIDYEVESLDGLYGFPGLAIGGNYVVTPEKDINPLNGVSTFDLVKISQHILEVQALGSPYKIISADVNHDGNVSTVDLVQLRRLILFIDTEFQNNTSWRFVEADFVFPDATDPFLTSFPEVFSVNGLTLDVNDADFIAMKIGDVNNSASPNGFTGGADDRSVGELTFAIQDQEMKVGETYTVDFTANDFAAVYGYQFTLGFDNSAVEFEGIEAGALTNLNDANFGMAMLNEGVITTSWNNSTAVSMDKDAVLFSMTFTANANAKLSDVISINSRYTKAEAYDNTGLLDINVEFNTTNGVTVAGGVFELYQNQPNPFKAETNIGFNLPEAGFATLTVYDVSGRVLRVVEGDFAKGYNEVTLNRSEVAGTGVLYYQLDTENDSATKKMIIIK